MGRLSQPLHYGPQTRKGERFRDRLRSLSESPSAMSAARNTNLVQGLSQPNLIVFMLRSTLIRMPKQDLLLKNGTLTSILITLRRKCEHPTESALPQVVELQCQARLT